MLFRADKVNPSVGFVGSSNLTLPGLSKQGELNVDVMDGDTCTKLAKWFEDRWADRWCIDISDKLAEIIEESWAGERLVPPYHVYLKMAYHLSREARGTPKDVVLPRDLDAILFEYQKAAVKLATRKLLKRGGVMIGDVVGLGKTLMATTVAKILEDDHHLQTLIVCPAPLVKMWEDYRERYGLRGKVISISRAIKVLPELRRYTVLLIDESHNLRNREGTRYKALLDYARANECRTILLSATPYNKSFQDLGSQLRLIVPEDKPLAIRPETYIEAVGGETEFIRKHQCAANTLRAFEHSERSDDWREMMKLYLVRRTRSFVKREYAKHDPDRNRYYLMAADGKPRYFPERQPRALRFEVRDGDPADQFATLYSTTVEHLIGDMRLPRYGLQNYLRPFPEPEWNKDEERICGNLSKSGRRLMGFCRIGLFKRLESSGSCFLDSLKRHILRNLVLLHALEHKKPVPIGAADVSLFDTISTDADPELANVFDPEDEAPEAADPADNSGESPAAMRELAALIYNDYRATKARRFEWLRADLFNDALADDLRSDCTELFKILAMVGPWKPANDRKLAQLVALLKTTPNEKVLVFSQFADTVRYLGAALIAAGIQGVDTVSGGSGDPTTAAWKFSPRCNEKTGLYGNGPTRVLVATDVLSEGQNLQDCAIVVNFDLPWAIIRLIQRAGRIDRIGQTADTITCYSFVPADGVERIINLRGRIMDRLRANNEVVGGDESFFDDDPNHTLLLDLYNEKSGTLDAADEGENDPDSEAFAIWKRAIEADPSLAKKIPALPDVVLSAMSHRHTPNRPQGTLSYVRMGNESDALLWSDESAKVRGINALDVLRAAACLPETPALPHAPWHHASVAGAVDHVRVTEKQFGGQLGGPRSARFQTYERLKGFANENRGTLFVTPILEKAIEAVYRSPLRESAKDSINRILKQGVTDDMLASTVTGLFEQGKLVTETDDAHEHEASIVCSLGLISPL